MTEVPDLEALVRGSLSGDNMAHAQLLREVARLLRPFLVRRLVVEGYPRAGNTKYRVHRLVRFTGSRQRKSD